jgi:hypothetical protein
MLLLHCPYASAIGILLLEISMRRISLLGTVASQAGTHAARQQGPSLQSGLGGKEQCPARQLPAQEMLNKAAAWLQDACLYIIPASCYFFITN